jgi:hypothetical protein
MTVLDDGATPCSFCSERRAVFVLGPVAICRSCAEVARRALSADASEIRLELAWGGHEGRDGCQMLVSASELSLLADTLVEVGIVAPVQRLPNDERLRRAEDFLPDRSSA